jgi:hypothetical protein
LTDAEHAIVVKGHHAELLLNNEAFATAINDLSNEIASKLLSTQEFEKQAREQLYYLHKAVEYLVATLRAARNAKATVEHNAVERELEAQAEEVVLDEDEES